MSRNPIQEKLIEKVCNKDKEGVLELIESPFVNLCEYLPRRPSNEVEIGFNPISGKTIQIKFAPERSIFHQLVILGWIEEAQHAAWNIRSSGTSVDVKDLYGETPLVYAVVKGHYGLAEYFVARGASLTPTCRDNSTIFHTLATIDNPNAIEFIAKKISPEKKAELTNSTNMYNSTPLMAAAQKGCTSTVSLLLSYGADVNSTNEDDMTAFMFAVESGDIEAARLLKDAGSDINHIAGKLRGMDSLVITMCSRNFDMLDALIDMGANWNTNIEVFHTSKSGDKATVVVEAGVIVQAFLNSEFDFAQRIIEKVSVRDSSLKVKLVKIFKDLIDHSRSQAVQSHKALEFLESMGIKEASFELYKLHKTGVFKLSSDKEAHECLKKAAVAGYPKADAELKLIAEIAEQKKAKLLTQYIEKKDYTKALPLLEEGTTEHSWVKAIVTVGGILGTLSLKEILLMYKKLQANVDKPLKIQDITNLERIAAFAKQIKDAHIDLFSSQELELVEKVIDISGIKELFDTARKKIDDLFKKVSNPTFKDPKHLIPASIKEIKTELIKLAKLLEEKPYFELNELKAGLISDIEKVNAKSKGLERKINIDDLDVFKAETPAPSKKVEPKVEAAVKVTTKEYSFSIETLRDYADFKKGSKERRTIEDQTKIKPALIPSLEKALQDYITEHSGETTTLQTAIRLAHNKKVSAYFIVELLSHSEEKELRDAADAISLKDTSDVRSSYGSLAGTSMFGTGSAIEDTKPKPDIAARAQEETKSTCSEDEMRENLEDTVNITPSTRTTLKLFFEKKYHKLTINDLENMLFDLGSMGYSWEDKGDKYVITMPDRPPVGGHTKHAAHAKSGKGQGAVIAMESLVALRESLDAKNIFNDYLNQDEKAAEAALLAAQAQADAADEAAARAGATTLELEKSAWIQSETQRLQSIALLERIRDGAPERGDLEQLPRAYGVLGIDMPDVLYSDITNKQVRIGILRKVLTDLLKNINGADSTTSEAATASAGETPPHSAEFAEIEMQRFQATSLFERIRDGIAHGADMTADIENLPSAYLALRLEISDLLVMDIRNKSVDQQSLFNELEGRLGVIYGTHHEVPMAGIHYEAISD